jgi:hypothetical protein
MLKRRSTIAPRNFYEFGQHQDGTGAAIWVEAPTGSRTLLTKLTFNKSGGNRNLKFGTSG